MQVVSISYTPKSRTSAGIDGVSATPFIFSGSRANHVIERVGAEYSAGKLLLSRTSRSHLYKLLNLLTQE
jgi:hypothetical protein